MRYVTGILVVALLIGGMLTVNSGPAVADVPPPPKVERDFITGGGWFIIQDPAVGTMSGFRANFGWHGGVKNGDWWGNGNYRDHFNGLHARSLVVTGYLRMGPDGTDAKGRRTGTRDICGIARTNLYGDVEYRVRMRDNGEPGRRDRFGISLFSNGVFLYAAYGSLGDPSPGGGNIQLHKGNDSNVPPDTPPDCPPFFYGDFFLLS